MASLDKMEGDTVEAVGLVLLGLLLYVAWLAYKGASAFKLPSLSDLLGQIQAFLNDLFNGAIDRLTPSPGPGVTGGAGGPVIYTGSSAGEGDTVDDYTG